MNTMTYEDKIQATAQDVLKLALQKGADKAEVHVSMDEGLTVNVRMNTVDQMVFHKGRSVEVVVYVGQHKGQATSSDDASGALETMVDAALHIARFTGEDAAFGLPDPAALAHKVLDLDLHHPWADLDPVSAVAWAREAEAAGLAVDPKITNSEGVEIHGQSVHACLANTLGFQGVVRGTRYQQQAVLLAQDEHGMQRDYAYTKARCPDHLVSASDVACRAAHKALARLNPRTIGTQKVPVVFAPEVATGLLRHWLAAVSGSKIYREVSFLCGALGQKIFPHWVTISESPHVPHAWGSAPFDAEGVSTRDQSFVVDGMLQQYVLDTYAARRLNMQTTGNKGGVHNLSITPNAGSQDDLCKNLSKGILVTEMMGQGVNLITGDYSRGASGFWVEHGEIQHPVEEITVAGNLKDMFMNLEAVGDDVDRRGSLWTGSWLVPNLTVASADL